ncbi:FUSC family protein [Legionella shakespearei]|uniref:p-hydroxybenzoic acid efflux pump subunit AaeB n=1 Tax=Legionella shakespearei DSM 23087 TaxID=1122169 RepID=A0A0W0Z8T6_9GAMM|nr:FUSC family protein [Legionella shakespearei]KTD65439.1 p-hydroxybenzoic acid efflux pump subunit AaeB [Legionella shakespearei DSM 23087]
MFYFWPHSVENRAALRTAIAALVAVLISFKFHLQTPYWSGMSVVIVSNLYTGSIIDKAMMRIIGTIAGAFLGFYVAGIVANSFLLYLSSCFLIIAVSVYYYNYSKYGYAYLLGALCAFIVISQLALNPQNALMVAIWRPVEIGIGVLVSAISAYAVFPNHLKDNILVQVHDIFADFIVEFKQFHEELSKGVEIFNTLSQSNLKIKKKIRKAVELIDALNHEFGVSQARIDELRAFLDSFYALCRQLQYLMITNPWQDEIDALKTLPLDLVFAAIDHDFKALQSAFAKGTIEPFVLKTEEAIADLEQQFKQKRADYSAKSDFIYSFIHCLQQINQNFILMYSLLTKAPVQKTRKFKLLNKQQRLKSDYDLIKQSIKSGLAVILALGFWMVSNWPGGLNGIISSLVISIRKNLFEMTNISIHRVLGCMLGGGIALLSLIVFEMNLYDFICVLFFSVWGFSYFMFKFTKYSYIGLQANIALIITLAQEGGPPVLLDPPLQRLAGIMIGIIASFIVANVIWRSDVMTILNRYLNKLYKYMTFNLNQVLLAPGDGGVSQAEVPGEGKSLHDLANLFWLSRGLIESLSAESLSAKKQERLKNLTQRFESLVVTQATISHILVTINQEKAKATAQRMGYDLSSYENNLVHCFQQHDVSGGLALAEQLKGILAEIESNPAFAHESDEDLRNMLAYVNALHQLALRVE